MGAVDTRLVLKVPVMSLKKEALKATYDTASGILEISINTEVG